MMLALVLEMVVGTRQVRVKSVLNVFISFICTSMLSPKHYLIGMSPRLTCIRFLLLVITYTDPSRISFSIRILDGGVLIISFEDKCKIPD